MNDTLGSSAPLVAGGPVWLTLSFVLIGIGVVFALFVLGWGVRLARRRQEARDVLEARGEVRHDDAPLRPAPPVAPAPPPIAETVLPASAPVAEPEPVAVSIPMADEPIAAAAPLDASPASLAASAPPAPASADDFTRMKGVGPKLAERLGALGFTRFDDLAALTPDGAAALDAQLGNFQGRIHRDRWIEQARFLAAGDVAGYEAVFGKL